MYYIKIEMTYYMENKFLLKNVKIYETRGIV
jgi:hypothetical protein